MKTPKIKRYRLEVSRTFPATHVRKGQQTYFIEKIQLALNILVEAPGDLVIDLDPKLHIIHGNFEYWKRIMEEVQAGIAIIELFYWSASPNNTPKDERKQVVFATLNKDSESGVQRLIFPEASEILHTLNGELKLEKLAENEGLSLDDFKEWFKRYDINKPYAIIHFTNFRY